MRPWDEYLKSRVQSIGQRFGLDVRRLSTFGVNPYEDMVCIKGGSQGRIVVFDVGANIGQTVTTVRDFFPNSVVHCFEPGFDAFQTLSSRYGTTTDVILSNVALGSQPERRELIDHETSRMSSFLPLGEDGWGNIIGTTSVDVTTVDTYSHSHGVKQIDLLKIDTQGFELEVLTGASSMLSSSSIDFVLAEVNFAPLYVGSPSLHDLTDLLEPHGFRLVSIYNMRHLRHRAGWADVLETATAPA